MEPTTHINVYISYVLILFVCILALILQQVSLRNICFSWVFAIWSDCNYLVWWWEECHRIHPSWTIKWIVDSKLNSTLSGTAVARSQRMFYFQAHVTYLIPLFLSIQLSLHCVSADKVKLYHNGYEFEISSDDNINTG